MKRVHRRVHVMAWALLLPGLVAGLYLLYRVLSGGSGGTP